MLVYVALSSDCCGDVFEGIFPTLDAAKARVANSPRPEGVEEWIINPSGDHAPVRRWDLRHQKGTPIWLDPYRLHPNRYS